LEIKDFFETAIIPFIGWLSTAVFTNTKRAQRLRTIGEAFDSISQQLTDFGQDSSPHKRLIAAVRLRRFFDKEGEHTIRSFNSSDCPYEKDAIGVISALLKTAIGDEDPALQKALADSLAYASDISGADLQGADLSNAFLGNKAGSDEVSLQELDFFQAKLIGASLKFADCRGAKFVQAEMRNCVMDSAKLMGADFRWANLTNARFKKSELTGANFEGANLNGANFAGAELINVIFKDCQLDGTIFTDAKNIPHQLKDHIDNSGIFKA
jgi:uncharacterized protein YjbI with pentapeptide repeats